MIALVFPYYCPSIQLTYLTTPFHSLAISPSKGMELLGEYLEYCPGIPEVFCWYTPSFLSVFS